MNISKVFIVLCFLICLVPQSGFSQSEKMKLNKFNFGIEERMKIARMEVPELLNLIENTKDEQIRAAAISELYGKKGNHPDVGPALMPYLDSKNAQVRYKAVHTLGSGYHPYMPAREKILEILRNDENPAIRDTAMEALSHLGGIPEEEASSLNSAARGRDLCTEVQHLFVNFGSNPEDSLEKILSLYEDYYHSKPEPSERDLCLFGQGYRIKEMSQEYKRPIREILVSMLEVGISDNARINILADLHNLTGDDPDLPEVICKQLEYNMRAGPTFVANALKPLGLALKDCEAILAKD